MISANIATIILPTRTVRVLDMQSPGLLLHRQPLEVGNLELDLIKGVDRSPTLQGNAGRGFAPQTYVASNEAVVPPIFCPKDLYRTRKSSACSIEIGEALALIALKRRGLYFFVHLACVG